MSEREGEKDTEIRGKREKREGRRRGKEEGNGERIDRGQRREGKYKGVRRRGKEIGR